MSDELRCTLTLPGAVALGAYEGGAVAALLSALRGIREHPRAPGVTIDSICASSSGSLTALLVARCLVEGLDPVRVLHRAWVTDAGLGSLFGRGLAAPLTFQALRKSASEMLTVPDEHVVRARQDSPVHVSFGLANLRGLGYDFEAVSSPGHRTVTHVDWADFRIGPDEAVTRLTGPPHLSALDAALASAANQLAFPAQLLRRAADEESYVEDGVQNFPPSRAFWYTDSAFLYREPIGRSLHLARRLDTHSTDRSDPSDQQFRRLHVVVEPQPLAAAEGDDWADPATPPSWLGVLRRSASILQAQSTYDDISRVSDTNKRLLAVEDLAQRLSPVLEGLSDDQQAQLRETLDGGEGETPELLRRALARAAGVVGKKVVSVEVIAPQSFVDGRPTPRPLAGRGLFRFAGFLDETLRQLDFDAGYDDTIRWLTEGGLERHELSDEVTAAAVGTAREAYQPPPAAAGGARTVPLLAQRDLARLLLRVTAVAGYDLVRQAVRRRRGRAR
jgi:hypothetical protein